jgi:uncharacterized RDD family membrane protein YckC
MTNTFLLFPGGGFRRVVAFQLDALLVAGLWLLLASWLGAFYLSVSRRPADLLNLSALAGLLLTLGVVLHAAYSIVFLGGCGQTPGKMLLDLRVVRENGGAVGYSRAGWRWVAAGIAALPLGLGFLGAFLTREKRGLHDLLAGTRVVRCGPVRA